MGDMGHALARYNGFGNRGFQVTMLFDNNPKKIGQIVNGLEIFDVDGMLNKIRDNKVKIAILAVPASAAQSVADQLVKAGIKSILNYAPLHLNVPKGVHVQHIDPALHLQRMTYYL